MSSPSSTHFDPDMFRVAVEEGDTGSLVQLFAEDAEFEMIDRRTPPSQPTVVRGRSAIGDLMRQIHSREMTHEVLQCVIEGDHAAYTERCVYPDGNKVLSMAMLDLADGRIVHQSTVQAWDEEPSAAPVSEDFSEPARVDESPMGRIEFAHIGGRDVVRMVLQPGWRWSEHVKPNQGTDLCMMHHSGYLASGTMGCRMADGTEAEFGAGEVIDLPPGHDGWVVGEETAVFIDWRMCE
ncbi:hypothetical protein GCM10007079_23340 [Nocardiopsis terrae]|uniref:Ketosteroid isomerase-like protein n=1 Tax=Nocardiopsis terrae TaxID=372655 RepID=A0ABR9HGB3_9ACTN|nr:nuclear transport factor 2 family protein [Nocardiopsis terrae]MBE1458058.1 ketosteroid isomerase-like protein [Nocardiopsis terrae]GHC82423.1 hypothetical protein GCM10007079_23340 [Nocardiopsis terrae]